MSDIKPKRPMRDAGRRDTSADDAAGEQRTQSTPAAAPPEPATPSGPAVFEAAPASEPPPALPPPTASAGPTASAAADDAWVALAEMQAALARGFEEIASEVSGMTRSGIAATADAAVALIGARTLAEAIEINAGLTRRRLDAMIEGSARLSEIGVKTATAASRPILSRFGEARSTAALG